MIGHIFGWIVAGLIVGALARLIVPGKQNMSIALTIVLGIVGALVGGFISTMLFGPPVMTDATGTYRIETAWPGWIMSVIGGVLVLWAYLAVTGNRNTTMTPTNRLP